MKPIASSSLMLLCISLGTFYSCSKKTSAPTPVISSIYPTHGAVGDTVTITGSGFQSSPSLDNVWFNGKPTTVISATSTQLEVTVPPQCGTGNVTVSVNGTDVPGPVFTYNVTAQLATFATGLSQPEYLTIDGSGNLYVTNFGDGIVSKISPAGVTSTFASGFSQPTGIALDGNGNLYVASNSPANTCTIEKITSSGTVSAFTTITGYIYGLTIDNSGNLYAANSTTSSISKVTSTGIISTFANGISGITDIVVASNGILYATGATNGAVYEIGQGSVNNIITGFSFGGPNGIAVDNFGNLYITVFGNNTLSQYNTVTQLNTSGMLTTFAAGLDDPCGLAIDANGNFFIANALGGT